MYPYFPLEDDFIYDENSPLGSMFLTIHCVTGNEELVVKIKRAKDLIPTPGAEYCDPFLTVSISPNPDGKFAQKSKVYHFTNAPYFDEQFIFQKVTPQVMETSFLEVIIHNNLVAPPAVNVLGGLKFQLSKVGMDLIMPTWLPLKKVPPPVVIQEEVRTPTGETPPELHTQLFNHLHGISSTLPYSLHSSLHSPPSHSFHLLISFFLSFQLDLT